MKLREALKRWLVTPELEEKLDRIPTAVGSFGYDPWGFNTDVHKINAALFRVLYEKYFRVETHGLENVPAQGRVLVIPNHSGQLPFDGALVGYALATNPHGPRAVRAMVERFFPAVPYVGNWVNTSGGVVGDPVNCRRMLEAEQTVIVFPEGVRGSGKPFRKRYQLQRFGNGFMHLAIAHHTPVLPVAVIGGEETIPALENVEPLARLLGLPYVPIAFPAVLPVKVRLHFGQPMTFTGDVDSEHEVTQKVEEVKDAIRALIEKGLAARKGWFR